MTTAAVPQCYELTTANQAAAAGLPVYVWCAACARPPRAVDLGALVRRRLGDIPVGELAREGRFKCSACGRTAAQISPTLDVLVTDRLRLRIRCSDCGRDQALTAREAIERWGLDKTFHDLRLELRCSHGHNCRVNAGAMLPAETIERGARAFFTAAAIGGKAAG